MNPTIPQLDPLPIPAPPGLLWFLLILTFFLHLVPMNFVLGGTPIALVARLRARDGAHPHHAALAGWFARALPVAIAAAVSFGVAPLLFVQALYGRLFFTSSVLMARSWFAVIPILILCYYGAYGLAFRAERSREASHVVAFLMTIGFLAIGFIYSNNMSLMLRPDVFAAWYRESGGGFHLDRGDAALAPRFLHFLLGAVAVAGIVVAWVGVLRRRSDEAFARWAVRYGSIWFVTATLLNVIAGLWWLGAMPPAFLLRFVGVHPLASIALGGGIVAGLAALVLMAIASFAPNPYRMVHHASTAMILTLVGMILARDQLRRAAFDKHGFEANPWVAPQWGPILIFAVLLLVALGLLIWMIVTFGRAGRSRST
jgi:hypothetical protein